ncbi:MAG: conjugal transfer protein TraC, partial [Gammaproteobacteria bacterium]|nr:conjugal transfer protein TraC [Gammaproteobacteria bacterium]
MLAALTKSLRSLFAEPSPGVGLKHKTLPPSQAQWKALLQQHRLSQLLPYESWDEVTGLYYNEDSVACLLEVTPAVGMDEETLRILSGIYNGLPAGTTVQYTLYASPDVLPLMKRWADLRQEDEAMNKGEAHHRAHHRHSNIYRATLRRRVDYLLGGNWQSLFSDQAMLIRDFRIMLSVSRPLNEDSAADQMVQIRESVSGTLRSAGLTSRPMDASAFINIMDSLLNPRPVRRDTLRYQDDQLLREQMVDNDTVMMAGREGLALQHGETVLDLRMYSAREYPATWAGWGMDKLIGDVMSNTLRIPCPFMMTFIVHIPDQVAASGEAKYKSARATQMADSQMGKYVPVWKDRKADWDFVSTQLQAGHALVRGGFQVVLFAPQGTGNLAEHQLKALYKSAGWTLTRDSFVSVHAFLSALPMMAGPGFVKELESFSRLRTFLTWSCANLAPATAELWGTGT